jgi:hypothetical protein
MIAKNQNGLHQADKNQIIEMVSDIKNGNRDLDFILSKLPVLIGNIDDDRLPAYADAAVMIDDVRSLFGGDERTHEIVDALKETVKNAVGGDAYQAACIRQQIGRKPEHLMANFC